MTTAEFQAAGGANLTTEMLEAIGQLRAVLQENMALRASLASLELAVTTHNRVHRSRPIERALESARRKLSNESVLSAHMRAVVAFATVQADTLRIECNKQGNLIAIDGAELHDVSRLTIEKDWSDGGPWTLNAQVIVPPRHRARPVKNNGNQEQNAEA